MVLDSHTHSWGPPSADHPWVNGPIVENDVADYSVSTVFRNEALLAEMDAAGVDEAVVVGYPVCEWTDNWYTVEAAEEHDRLYGIVMVDQFADDAAQTLRDAMAVDDVLGFRLGGICPYDRMWETFDTSVTWLRDAIHETEFWNVAVETDAVVQVLVHVDQLDQAVELVEAYPELTFLFDHFAYADPETPLDEGGFDRFADLAEYDSVGVKISEVVHQSNTGYPYTDMHDHVRWLLDAFGRERVVWGSDFPNVSDEARYEETLTWLDHVDELSDVDREWLTGRSFRRLTGLE
ncbi:Amidohydrolase [Halogranum rubrum]|uniref:Amidohydrolase n=1 Tax=Halogranum rubrum TaxID=553466 RepID=A0A1I4GX74_9EURY|nr:amidohydrolase family protein [Halogranum rubrum]SFL33741.1 Amidohydrolase [Halogranum rubrum]